MHKSCVPKIRVLRLSIDLSVLGYTKIESFDLFHPEVISKSFLNTFVELFEVILFFVQLFLLKSCKEATFEQKLYYWNILRFFSSTQITIFAVTRFETENI